MALPHGFQITCGCGKRLNLPHASVGRPARCPSCKQILRIVAHGADTRVSNGVLLLERGTGHQGERIYLGGSIPIAVGQSPDNDLRLDGDRISGDHCRLIPVESGWRIEDHGSSTGSYVNGERTTARELQHGDRVRLGEYVLTYLHYVANDPGMDTKTPVEKGIYTRVAEGEFLAERPGPAPKCPSCGKELPKASKICVACGVSLKSGRGILTADETGLNEIYGAAEVVVRWVSWLFPIGICPIASEGFGTRKPYVTWFIAVVTVVTSVWFLAFQWSGSPRMREMKNLMLWAGDAEPDPETLLILYTFTSFGDSESFFAELEELDQQYPRWSGPLANLEAHKDQKEAILQAHHSLPPARQCVGQYRPSQLITHAFLHGGIIHLVSNLIFLLVFGSRVNALIGNVLTLPLYPLLAVGAAVSQILSMSGEPIQPMLGASGAIMGLAGMYWVLFPLHKVHLVAWCRWWDPIHRFQFFFNQWSARGFWVVLFYIAFDVIFTALRIDDGTAHWAHLGGFIVGAALALILLLGRVINARGGDILSAILGRRAWPLVGPPNRPHGFLQRLP